MGGILLNETLMQQTPQQNQTPQPNQEPALQPQKEKKSPTSMITAVEGAIEVVKVLDRLTLFALVAGVIAILGIFIGIISYWLTLGIDMVLTLFSVYMLVRARKDRKYLRETYRF